MTPTLIAGAVFALVHALLLQPLPYPAAERLVLVWTTTGSGQSAAAWPEYLDWRAQSRSNGSASRRTHGRTDGRAVHGRRQPVPRANG